MRLLAALIVLLLPALAACSSGDPDSAPTPDPEVSVSTAPPPPPAPKVGSCHLLTFDQATQPVDAGQPVGCRQPHTSVTTKVGKLSPVVDGHLLAVDSRTVQARIAKACPPTLGPFVGGDQTTQRLSRFEVVWFSPSVEQADAGANWFRCDVVGVRSADRLINLPAQMKGVLDDPAALDTYGTCGTAKPATPTFERVVCSAPHTWRAVDVVDLPKDARFLAKDVAATGDAACKDVAADRANGALQYSWAFEWPTRAQWTAGQRYGYCWVPEG